MKHSKHNKKNTEKPRFRIKRKWIIAAESIVMLVLGITMIRFRAPQTVTNHLTATSFEYNDSEELTTLSDDASAWSFLPVPHSVSDVDAGYTVSPAHVWIYTKRICNVYLAPYQTSMVISTYPLYTSFYAVGKTSTGFWVIDLDGVQRYVLEDDVTRNREEIEEMKTAEAERLEAREEAFAAIEQRKEEERAAYWRSLAEQTRNPNWSGPVLSKSRGSITGPTGRETYYNLNMDVIVRIMRRMGFSEEEYPYWVRNDGCKMLGPYIMCAANFNMFPRGTSVECSLGTCLVCDTGGFAADNPTQLDIAVVW